jgi:hypothetical protein
MYIGVPMTVPVRVRRVSSAARARPKSPILAWPMLSGAPSDWSRMFDGLMSRWTTPRSWAAARPAAISAPSRAMTRQSGGPWVLR